MLANNEVICYILTLLKVIKDYEKKEKRFVKIVKEKIRKCPFLSTENVLEY